MKGPEINGPDQINEPVGIVTMVRAFGPNFISGATNLIGSAHYPRFWSNTACFGLCPVCWSMMF